MSTRILWILLLLASALVALLGYQLGQARGLLGDAYEAASRPRVGSWLPTVAAVTLEGRPITLAPAGTAQVLYFFTPECPYCQSSAPEVQAFYNRLHGTPDIDVEFVGIGGGGDKAVAVEARRRGFGFPVVGLTPKLADLFKARQVPLLLVVGPNGQVRYSKVGVFVNKEDATPLMAALTRTDAGPTAE